jgi:hypothetical protein
MRKIKKIFNYMFFHLQLLYGICLGGFSKNEITCPKVERTSVGWVLETAPTFTGYQSEYQS